MSSKIIIKSFIALAAFIVVIIGLVAYRLITISGIFINDVPHFSGACQPIFGIVGGEDITIDDSAIAWVSSTDRRSILRGRLVRGAIHVIDLTKNLPIPKDITPSSPSDFRPHGINLWTSPQGERFLFVVNHPAGGPSHILRYRISKTNQLQLTGLFRSPAIDSPNDIVAIGKNQFYITNDLGSKPEDFWYLSEVLLGFPAKGSVAFFDGSNAKLILENLQFPNGINVSKDGKQIYIAELNQRRLLIFDRDLDNNQLTLRKKINVSTALDNLELDEYGNLWTAAHPKIFAFGRHIENNHNLAPSQVLKINPRTEKVEEIFYDDGRLIKAAATAAVYKQFMLLGPVFDDHILLCRMR